MCQRIFGHPANWLADPGTDVKFFSASVVESLVRRHGDFSSAARTNRRIRLRKRRSPPDHRLLS
jgi:hypothetical protein